MTRKHFEIIAQINKDAMSLARNYGEREVIRAIAETQANKFAGINPNFDRVRFLDASGVIV